MIDIFAELALVYSIVTMVYTVTGYTVRNDEDKHTSGNRRIRTEGLSQGDVAKPLSVGRGYIMGVEKRIRRCYYCKISKGTWNKGGIYLSKNK